MKTIPEKFQDALGSVVLTDEQKEALKSFFEEYDNALKAETSSPVKSEDEINAMIAEAIQEKIDNKELVQYDIAKSAFDRLMSDSEKAFELFREDAEKAFDEGTKDIMEEVSRNSLQSIQDLYSDLEKRAFEEVKKSPQFNAIKKIQQIVSEEIFSPTEDETRARLVALEEEKRELESRVTKMKMEETITRLTSDFPEKEARKIRNFLEERSKTEDEIYDNFSAIVSILEAQQSEEVNPKVVEQEENPESGETPSDQIETAPQPTKKKWKFPSKKEKTQAKPESEKEEVTTESTMNGRSRSRVRSNVFVESNSVVNSSTKKEQTHQAKRQNPFLDEFESNAINRVFANK